ncbi:unnamed protein product [Brassicogethes aeneus]|uniref:Uncharacterized protein n=1 Tax=Brassicogethes aeneus TaxID=1431903 RepID=A0A9P0FHN9_BRAAE|nr:unnamed protein product [Brassicogethes aeneus]
MVCQKVIFAALLIVCASAVSLNKLGAVVTIQATNNTQVPSITYTVNAVECLKEAYEIYADEALVGEAYLELFQAKHPGNWSVAIGYTTIISKSDIFVETMISGGAKDYKLTSDKKGTLVRIFN